MTLPQGKIDKMKLSEQEIVRRDNLQKIRELGIDPYPSELFPVNVLSKEVKENFDADKNNYQEVVMAGRLMMKRIMGKASFAEFDEGRRVDHSSDRTEGVK